MATTDEKFNSGQEIGDAEREFTMIQGFNLPDAEGGE